VDILDGPRGKFGVQLLPVASRPQPIQLTTRIPSPSTKKPMILCSTCNVRVRKDRWDKHVRKVHSSDQTNVVQKPTDQQSNNRPEQPTMKYLGQPGIAVKKKSKANLEADKRSKIAAKERAGRNKAAEQVRKELGNLSVALKKLTPGFHRAWIEALQRQQRMLRAKLRRLEGAASSGTTKRPRSKRASGSGRGSAGYEEALSQSLDETREGGKYLGQMRREGNGRFGSLPLYDDYGEESGPD
jgi:hypothetical protein